MVIALTADGSGLSPDVHHMPPPPCAAPIPAPPAGFAAALHMAKLNLQPTHKTVPVAPTPSIEAQVRLGPPTSHCSPALVSTTPLPQDVVATSPGVAVAACDIWQVH
jgi:hypothetical protein